MGFGLALSGGGIRGAAHIGVLRALEDEGLYPSWISGTSAGSIVGGLYAYGYDVEDLTRIALELGSRYIDPNYLGVLVGLWQWTLGREPKTDGLIRGRAIEKYLEEITEGINIRNITMPLAITAVDINSAETVIFTNRIIKSSKGHEKIQYIRDVTLYRAIRASIGIPVIFRPTIIGGRRLVDGGLTENLPVGVLKAMGAGKIIGVNLGYNGRLRRDVDNVLEIGSQSLDIMAYEITTLKSHGADFILKPKIYDTAFTESAKIPECIEKGYNATKENMGMIKKAINSSPSTPLFYSI